MTDGLITFDKPLKIDCYHCGRFIDIEESVFMDNHHFCPECAEEIKKAMDDEPESLEDELDRNGGTISDD